MQSWYALNTKPGAERLVSHVLNARGLEPYVPMWSPAIHRVTQPSAPQPYFPSYLFVRCDLEAVGISGLQYVPGVRRLIFSGDRPALVLDRTIAELRARLIDLEAQMAQARLNPFKHGERVIIREGVFAGYEALFDRRLSSGARVRVLVDFLQRRMPVEIDSAHIQSKRFA